MIGRFILLDKGKGDIMGLVGWILIGWLFWDICVVILVIGVKLYVRYFL